MELKIYSPHENGFAQVIQWNYEELKQEITDTVQEYETSVYSDDMIRQAKSDRAKLRKFVDAMEAKRKEIKKKYLDPYEQFEREEKELVSIVQKAINNIDSQIKDFEERQRAEKTKQIREFYEDNIHDIGQYLPFERVFRTEYANASTSMKLVKAEILEVIQKVDEGLAILNEVDSKFIGDMKAVFLRTYDIGQAMAERNRLEAEERLREEYMAEQQRRKQERETAEKEEARRVMEAGRRASPETQNIGAEVPTNISAAEKSKKEDPVQDSQEKKYTIDFRIHVTKEQLNSLKEFLKANGIRYEPVPKQ